MNGEQLHKKLRDVRNKLSRSHATRLHRAISWIEAADKYAEDDDIAFLSLWIAFNSCYAVENDGSRISERQSFNEFIENLVDLDNDKQLYNTLWSSFSGFTKALIDNQYVFEPFWVSQRNEDRLWENSFDKAKKAAYHALANEKVPLLFSIVIDRLYVLRNQLAHGGATYASSINREQVRDGRRFMSEVMPIMVDIMMRPDNGDIEWDSVNYPVIE